jgi:hypothetical protein
MDLSELLLGIGVLVVSAINSVVVMNLVREQESHPSREEKTEEKAEKNQAQDYSLEVVPPPKRPTTKAEILAWRSRIIED